MKILTDCLQSDDGTVSGGGLLCIWCMCAVTKRSGLSVLFLLCVKEIHVI